MIVDHERCPACAKLGKDRHADNLAVYEDGSEYCFSCGYYHQPNRKGLSKGPRSSPETTGYLPHDVSTNIDSRALQWLSKYFITHRDVVAHKMLWSDSWERLIFPVNDCWQGRYFGSENKPKWYSRGDIHNNIHLLGPGRGRSLVLVEDLVSAIRVSAVSSVAPLFGSDIPDSWYRRLSMVSPRLSLWLDWDKRTAAVKYAKRLNQFGFECSVIVTKQDPKELTEAEIEQQLV